MAGCSGETILDRKFQDMRETDRSLYNDSCILNPGSSGDSCLPQRPDMILLEADNRYHSFFENMEQGYYEIDRHGRFIFFNEFICKIFGYGRDELSRISYRKFMDKENARLAYHAFYDVFATEKPRIGCVFQIARKDGVKRQVGVSICLMKDAEGKKIGFSGIARDISERQIMEAHKRHAQKLESIGQLAAGIAHEINTPIQYTTDNTHFLQDSFTEIESLLKAYHKLFEAVKPGRLSDPVIREIEMTINEIDLAYLEEEIPKAIKQSLEGLDHVAKIVSAMKQFSHPGTDEKVFTDINKAIQNIITISRNEWKYVAEIIMDLDSSMPMVPCLPGEFNQVILNIIVNAAHAVADSLDLKSGEKGTITVKTRFDDTWAEIRISDTGTGIPKEIRDKIFDPFFTTKEVGKGSGQGLAISHSVIVSKHGGSIDFETEINQGTTMIIRLPMSNGHG
jgi:PAS domain S-box-containing protein